jgi:hypothetical protein
MDSGASVKPSASWHSASRGIIRDPGGPPRVRSHLRFQCTVADVFSGLKRELDQLPRRLQLRARPQRLPHPKGASPPKIVDGAKKPKTR